VLVRQAIYTKGNLDALIESGQEWNFHQADTGEHLHSLHPYPAKFIPQIPRTAIERWTEPGGVVYDPFCGCGTTLLEASLLGRPSIGVDNNAVAVLVSRAKTAVYNKRDVARLVEIAAELKALPHSARARRDLIPQNENFHYWFDEAVVHRLSVIKGCMLEVDEPLQTLLLAIFSSVIVRVSFQDSDTRYAKISRTVVPADVDRAIRSKLEEVVQRLGEIPKAKRARVTIHQADTRQTPFIKDDSVDLIVTSPPYLNAYDYHKYHRQRLHWLGGDIAFARDVEIGKHDDFTRPRATPDKYFEDMSACFGEWQRVLRKNAKCLILIGDAIVTKEAVPVGDRFISLLTDRSLKLQKHWIREVLSTRKAFNGQARMSHEHVMLFQKGA
jgi:DNA modification methylase